MTKRQKSQASAVIESPGMFYLLLTLLAGSAAGLLMRKAGILSFTGKAISATVLIMLFLLGVETGADENILSNLHSLGTQALILAIAGILGSATAAGILYRVLSGKRDKTDA